MNATENVRRAFRSKYFFDVQPTWLHACLAWLRDQFQLTDLTNSYTLEKVYNQWLHTDIALIADACCLPNDLDLNAKKIQLTGRYALQINSILCISEPYYSQALDIQGDHNDNERIDTDITDTQQWKPPPPKRVLYLELTDGKTILRGVEYEPVSGLDRDTTLPGAKILVSGPVFFRRGMLLLTSKNTQVLGGYAENLVNQNSSIETALKSLSKTASNLEESRMRFHRLNIKVHAQMVAADPTNSAIPDRPTDPTIFREDEDEMDAYIRQAYADGVINDDSHIAPDPTDYDPPLPPPSSSSYYTTQLSTATTTTITTATDSRIPFSADDPDELILLSDDDDTRSSHIAMPPSSPPFSYNQSARSSSTLLPPAPPTPPPPTEICLPYTYLSLIRREKLPAIVDSQDFLIKGCFASIVANPRVVKNEFDLEVILNDGSDCIRVRLAPEFLNQHLGTTAMELMARRKACHTEADKKKLQSEFNERLKQFGHAINLVNATMTVRFFSDNRLPMVTHIDEN